MSDAAPEQVYVPMMGLPPRVEHMARPLMMAPPGAFAHTRIEVEITRLLWCVALVLALVVSLTRAATG
jgi:hypothetical protein